MSFDKPSQLPPQDVTEAQLLRKIAMEKRDFLRDFVTEESRLIDLPEEGEEEDVSREREAARVIIQELLELQEEARADVLRKTRENILKYREILDDSNDSYGEHHDLVPRFYRGMSGSELKVLLKMLPENAAILKDASDILQMPLEEAREKLEEGE